MGGVGTGVGTAAASATVSAAELLYYGDPLVQVDPVERGAAACVMCKRHCGDAGLLEAHLRSEAHCALMPCSRTSTSATTKFQTPARPPSGTRCA